MLNLLRILCLLVLVLAGLTAWAWTEKSAWIASVEWHLIDRYKGSTPDRIGEIKGAVYQGEWETHLQELDEIRTATAEFEYGDRKFEFWRAAVDLQSESLIGLKRTEEALVILKDAVNKVPRSIPLALRYAHCLSLSSNLKDRRSAQDWVQSWTQRFPKHPLWISARHFLALQSKDTQRISLTLDQDLQAATRGAARNWQLFLYPVGQHPVPTSPLIDLVGPDAAGRFAIEYNFGVLPHEVRQIRLDPPSGMPLLVENPRLVVMDGEVVVDALTDLPWNHLDGAWLAPEGYWVVESARDQKLNIRLAEPIRFEGSVKVRFEFEMHATLDRWFREALMDPSDRTALQEALLDVGSPLSVERVSPPVPSAP